VGDRGISGKVAGEVEPGARRRRHQKLADLADFVIADLFITDHHPGLAPAVPRDQLDRHGVFDPLHTVQRGCSPPGDDALSPSPQPSRHRVGEQVPARIFGQIDVRVNHGVPPPQRTTSKCTRRDGLCTDYWPHAGDGSDDH